MTIVTIINDFRQSQRFKKDLRSSGMLRSVDWKTVSNVSWTACPLKIGPKCCPETSVTNYQSTLRNITEEGRFQL
jgi:hypothetical protein